MNTSTHHTIPMVIAVLITFVAIWSGVNPVDRTVWWAEVIPAVAIFAILIITYPRFRFSNIAYILMSLWLMIHLIGAHYTFANVPFEWGNHLLAPLLGEERNHFDRLAHYTIGFYSYPMMEWLLRKRLCGVGIAFFFALFFIMSVASTYEIIEWQYAIIEGGDAGIEFLGSQGDIWDAQKDILADTLGALSALVLYFLTRPDRK